MYVILLLGTSCVGGWVDILIFVLQGSFPSIFIPPEDYFWSICALVTTEVLELLSSSPASRVVRLYPRSVREITKHGARRAMETGDFSSRYNTTKNHHYLIRV